MVRKLLAAIAFLALPVAATAPAYAEDPPAAGAAEAPPAAAPEADDPDGQPYPPDGVTDPNATYPTDGTGDTTDQGEAGAAPPDAPPAGSAPPD
jgi:hypothetical protein